MAELNLDPKTLVFLLGLGSITSVLLFSIYIAYYKIYNSNLALYILGKLFQSIAWIVFIFFNDQFSNSTLILANIFLFFGLLLEVNCLTSFNLHSEKKKLVWLIILGTISIVTFSIVSFNFEQKGLATTIIYTLLFLYVFFELSIKPGRTKMRIFIGWMALLFALINIGLETYFRIKQVEIPVYYNIPVLILLGIGWIFNAFTFPILFMFMLKEKNRNELFQLNAAKDKFFRIIGHDLRAPIAQMIQISELLEEHYNDLPAEKILKLIKSINESSTRGFKLLENLLEWARVQTGTIRFEKESFSFSNLVEENFGLIKKNAEAKNIKLINNISGNFTFVADKNMINTVLRNLLSNAVKFTDSNGTIEIGNNTKQSKVHEIYIKDNGIGIEKVNFNKLFKIDTDYSSLKTKEKKGTGLGLILCKEFIEKHNGEIWFESEPGKGSTFYFTIPKNKRI